jgi:hypothetical protein
MATELYGVNAHVSETLVRTPVQVETNVVFFGTAPKGELFKPILITSWQDAVDKLGVNRGDFYAYGLVEACLAAFEVCNLSHIYCVVISNQAGFRPNNYSDAFSHIDRFWLDYGVIANILCVPGIAQNHPEDQVVIIQQLLNAAKKQCGKFDGIVVYDGFVNCETGQSQTMFPGYNEEPYYTRINVSDVVSKSKFISDENAVCHFGYGLLGDGAIVSGAAIRACRWAMQDMSNIGREPSRCSGNLQVGIINTCFWVSDAPSIAASVLPGTDYVTFEVDESESYYLWHTTKSFYAEVEWQGEHMEDFVTEVIHFVDGKGISNVKITGDQGNIDASIVDGHFPIPFYAAESELNELSANGIGSFLNTGGGKFVTWGDHTSAFGNGTIEDERGRFDNYPRMRMRVTNRFEQKWRPVIDAGMDLTLRNDILTEEQDFLYYLVSVRALIGSPRCEFSPIDNTKESISQGHFYFKDFITYTPPAKYIDLGVSFTDEGYTVYLED